MGILDAIKDTAGKAVNVAKAEYSKYQENEKVKSVEREKSDEIKRSIKLESLSKREKVLGEELKIKNKEERISKMEQRINPQRNSGPGPSIFSGGSGANMFSNMPRPSQGANLYTRLTQRSQPLYTQRPNLYQHSSIQNPYRKRR